MRLLGASFSFRTELLLTCAVLIVTGCTSTHDSAQTEVHVRAGQVEQVSPMALDVRSRAEVWSPSGVLSLGLATGMSSVSLDADHFVPDADVTLIGVTWSFASNSSSDARAVLLNGQPPESLPRPAVTLLDKTGEIVVPIDIGAGALIGTSDPVEIQVTYDGVTQRVDLATGAVSRGQARGLTNLGNATTTLQSICDARDFPSPEVLDNGCGVDAIHQLPYISGLGWAPDSGTWLVVDGRIEGPAKMLLDGRPGTVLSSAGPSIHREAYAIGANATPRTVDFDYRGRIGIISVALPK